MSEPVFSFGNLSAIREALLLPKGALFEQACQVAHRTIPSTPDEAQALAEACLAGFKTKAELLGKVFPRAEGHSKMLELTAAMCWFTSWHDLTEFVKKFPRLSSAERDGSMKAISLLSGCWNLVETDRVVPAVKMFLAYQDSFLRNFVQLDEKVLAELQHRVMFRQAGHKQAAPAASDEGFSVEEIHSALRFLGITPQRHILAMLHRVPVDRHHRRQVWPALGSLTVGKLLDMPLANQHANVGDGYAGWEHAIVEMLDFLEAFVAYSPDLLRKAGALKADISREKLKAKAESPLTRLTCREALQDSLKPFLKVPVMTALARSSRPDGYFVEDFDGTPEELEAEFEENYGDGRDSGIQRLAFKEPLEDFRLSVFRGRVYVEEAGLRLYNLHGFLHDTDNTMVGRVTFMLALSQGPADPRKLATAFDEVGEVDLREVGLGLVREQKEGQLPGADLRALLVIRTWEIKASNRRQGLGKRLLNESARVGSRNLAKPTFAVMRFQPYSQIEPIFDDWPRDYLPDVQQPFVELETITQHSVSSDTFLGKSVKRVHPAPYIWQCHANPTVQMSAMGALFVGAW